MRTITLVLALVVILIYANSALAVTLQEVKSRGYVLCGVSGALPGFSERDDQGNWKGIDVDICRAIAAALFGRSEKVKYVPLTAAERFTALRRGNIDVLSRNTTWTLSRDASGLEFAGVTFYDGQAFMVRRDLGVRKIEDLDGAAICVIKGTTTAIHLDDYFHSHDMTYSAVQHEPYKKVLNAYTAGECDVVTADQSALYSHRTTLSDPSSHVILQTVISREPLGPVVCQSSCEGASDDRWVAVIRWTLNALLEAESRGINSKNVQRFRAKSKDPSVRRLLGVEGELGMKLGLSNEWAFNIIRSVGNYREVYDRNLGSSTRLQIPRGLNALWKDGGVQYPKPFL